MLPSALTNNEVKNAAGTEVEFVRYRQDGNSVTYRNMAAGLSVPESIKISHLESGSGVNARRQSAMIIDCGDSNTDPTLGNNTADTHNVRVVVKLDLPIGKMQNLVATKRALAYAISLLSSTGADTVIKYDCTGTAADALASGSL